MLNRVNVLKFRTHFSFFSQINCWFSGLEFTKCLSKDPDQTAAATALFI